MNDFMSLGAHRLWKDELLRIISFSSGAKSVPSYVPRHLDVAGGVFFFANVCSSIQLYNTLLSIAGTGDVAFRSLKELSQLYRGCFGDLTETVLIENNILVLQLRT